MRLILAFLMALTGSFTFFGSATDSDAGNCYRTSGVRYSTTRSYHRPVVVRRVHRPVYRQVSYRQVSYRPVVRHRYRPTYTRYGRSHYSPYCR